MAALATVGGIKALVYDAVFKRAQEIATSDKLRAVVFEGEGLLMGTAECMGSSPSDVYVLSVSIDGAIAVGECSCPAAKSAKSGLCKHVVALLLRRIREVQEPKTSPLESPHEELVVSIASQIDDSVTRPDARKSADGGEASPSLMAMRTGPPTSSSKRALPAWMLGVVGSAASATPSSNKPKSNKRAAEPKPPRPAPPPTRRARRSGQPLKISNGSDEGEEDPGEVHDAVPMEEYLAPAVTEDEDVPETIDIPTEGAAARERRRLRALKKEVVVAVDEGSEEVKRTRGRSSRAVTKEVIDQPVRATKRRRFAKKYAEEDSDGSENRAGPDDADASDGFGLTDEDLIFPAQEQLEKDKAAVQAEDARPGASEEPIEEEKLRGNSSQGKKSSSIFSMSKWKEMSSEGRGTGGTLSLSTDHLDWDTLKNYSLGANSQSTSQFDRQSLNATDAADGIFPSLQTAESATTLKDVPAPMQIASRSDDIDAVANDMLDIFFGFTPSQVSAKNVPAASSIPIPSQEDKPCAAEVGLGAYTNSFPVPESDRVAPTIPAVRNDLGDLGVEPRPKKKSSLKDRVKMFLS